jgi:hypothetical protein
MMAGLASDMLEEIGNRRLFSLLLNTGVVGERDDKILYTDLAGLLLEKLGIKHNAKFLLEGRNGEADTASRVKFVDDNVEKIRAFNNKTILQE